MIIYLEIDDVICELTKDGEYISNKSRIEKINKLYQDGNTVIYWTSRSADKLNLTLNQFKKWEVFYTQIKFERYKYDIFLDKGNLKIEEYFKEN